MIVKLYEMSFGTKDVKDFIKNVQDEINENLIKSLMYDNMETVHHWLSEASSYLLKIQRKTINGKKLFQSKVYFKYLFAEPFEPFDEMNMYKMQYNISKDYNYQKIKFRILSGQEMYNKLKYMHTEICESLSKNDLNFQSLLRIYSEAVKI